MATPFSEIYRILNGRLTEKQKSTFDSNNKRKELLENAISEFEDYFRDEGYIKLYVDFNNDVINEELTLKEKKYLSLLMLKEYYRQRIEQYATIMNVVTDSTKVTGVDGTKKALQDSYDKVDDEIKKILSSLTTLY